MHLIERTFYQIVPKLAVDWPAQQKNRRKILRAFEATCKQGWFDRCIIVKGQPRVGKSVLVAQAAIEILEQRTNPEEIPIMMFRWPPRGAEKSLYSAFLRAAGHPLPYARSRDEMLDKVVRVKERLGLKMLIVEEAQHGARGKSRDERYYNGDVLKIIQDELRIPVLLVGVSDDLDRLLDDNPQIAGRAYEQIELVPFAWNVPQSRADFLEFLRILDEYLPFRERCHLDHPEVARAIFVSTGGLIGLIVQLIQAAADDAVDDAAPRIEVGHLERAHARLRQRYVTGANPFDGLRSLPRQRKG